MKMNGKIRLLIIGAAALTLLAGCSNKEAAQEAPAPAESGQEEASAETAEEVSSGEEDAQPENAGEAQSEAEAAADLKEDVEAAAKTVKLEFYNNCEDTAFTELYVSYYGEDGAAVRTDNLFAGPEAEESKGYADTYVSDYGTYTPEFTLTVPGKTDLEISAKTESGEEVNFEAGAAGCYVEPDVEMNLITLEYRDGTPVAEIINN